MDHKQQLLRQIPKVDEILTDPGLSRWIAEYSRSVVVEAVRAGLDRLRENLLASPESEALDKAIFSIEKLMPYFREAIAQQVTCRLKRVINATGVVIHTNLGRSLLQRMILLKQRRQFHLGHQVLIRMH